MTKPEFRDHHARTTDFFPESTEGGGHAGLLQNLHSLIELALTSDRLRSCNALTIKRPSNTRDNSTPMSELLKSDT